MNQSELLNTVKVDPLESTLGRTSNRNVLTARQLSMLARLERYEAPWLEEKLLKEEVFSSSRQYGEAFIEFKKYVGLISIFGKPLAMHSKPVDAVWHQFILFTKRYHTFCEEFLGFYLHHAPNTSFTSEADRPSGNFTEQYQALFGELHDLWDVSEKASCKDDCSSDCTGDCSSECTGDCKGSS